MGRMVGNVWRLHHGGDSDCGVFVSGLEMRDAEVQVRVFFHAVLLALLLSANGCTGMLIGNALNQGRDLTPEQIDAYNKVGSSVYGCLLVSGPPPSGATMFIIVPKGSTSPVKFGDGCHLLNQ